MSNLTITVDEETLRRARMRALAEGKSVNRLLREYLDAYSGRSREQSDAVTDLLDLANDAPVAGSGGRRWTRDELHERG
jgi:hypothetical protein